MFGTAFVNLPLDCTCETYFLCVGESGCSAGFCCFVGASKECVNTQWDCFLLTNIKQYPGCCTPSYLQGRKYFLVLDPGRKCKVPSRPHILL